jgi:hypothetical protein
MLASRMPEPRSKAWLWLTKRGKPFAEKENEARSSLKTGGFRQLHILIRPPRQAMEMTEYGKRGKP